MNYANLVAPARHRAIRDNIALSTLSVTPTLIAILGGSAPAFAQQAQAEQAGPVEEVVVTGTRIVRDGYEAPTPVSVISVDEIQNTGTPNIADYVNTLPAITGSSTPASTAGSIFGSQEGINGLNLRNLGTVRTLVLVDGQRVGPSIATGLVDISQIPQQLIQRVDVVTGGASAVYGSDALTGVVNFVMDNNFTGLKGDVSGGVTTYGDDRNWKVDLTGGSGFANGRGHVLISGEATAEDGVLTTNRPWNYLGWETMNNPAYTATNGQPQNLLEPQVSLSNATLGGEIACKAGTPCAPLRGIAFGPGGTPYNVVFGSIVSDPLMSGGSWNGASYVRVVDGEAIQPEQSRQNLFTRLSYEVADNWNVYGQATWSNLHSTSFCCSPDFFPGSLTVQANNAYIPASVATQVAALGITSFAFGTMDGDLPRQGYYVTHRQLRFVLGTDGKFDAFGKTWKVNAYAESSFSMNHDIVTNTMNVPNFTAAINAVKGPNGSIVCASTLTNPGNGCVPFDLFGTGVNNQAAINYVTGSPFQIERFLETVESVNITGEPFSDWAGPISVATGIEHRQEKGRGTSDPYEAAGVYFFNASEPVIGQFNVTEGYVETVVPLAKDQPWAKSLDLNGAIRVTGYDTGTVVTWKAGAEYAPIDDIRFRATQSRDIREPNLNELYTGFLSAPANYLDPFHNNVSVVAQALTEGNPNLVPEVANTTGAGVVVQPAFIPGFNASLDYYAINISNGIGAIGAQQILNLCYLGNAASCALVQPLTGGTVAYNVINAPINLAAEHASGLDMEASYHFDLQNIVSSWSGKIGLRALATRFLNDTVYSGVPGSIPVNSVGATTPRWRYTGEINYVGDPLTLTLTLRGLSGGVYNNNYIQCSSGCPASTVNNPTYNNDQIAGAAYFDFGASYKLTGEHVQSELYLNVRNLANKNPPAYGPGGSGYVLPEASYNYDLLGRVFRAGVRFKM